MTSSTERAREHLADDLANVLRDAEDLLKRAGEETGDRAQQLRSEAESKLLAAKLRLQELEGRIADKARAATRRTDEYVHNSPWTAIGIAAAVGFVAGLLINRR